MRKWTLHFFWVLLCCPGWGMAADRDPSDTRDGAFKCWREKVLCLEPTLVIVSGRYVEDYWEDNKLDVFADGSAKVDVQLAGLDLMHYLSKSGGVRWGLNTGLGIGEYEDAGLVIWSASVFVQIRNFYKFEIGHMYAYSGQNAWHDRDATATFVGISFPGISDKIKKLLSD